MNLTEEPRVVAWAPTHYLFIEKVGPFISTAPLAWKELHALLPEIASVNEITGYLSLYKMPDIYRAGVSLAAAPKTLPTGLAYEFFAGGKFSRFVLTGPYEDLGPASGLVWKIVDDRKIALRDDYAIENYVNDPRTTAKEDLITEILVPTL